MAARSGVPGPRRVSRASQHRGEGVYTSSVVPTTRALLPTQGSGSHCKPLTGPFRAPRKSHGSTRKGGSGRYPRQRRESAGGLLNAWGPQQAHNRPAMRQDVDLSGSAPAHPQRGQGFSWGSVQQRPPGLPIPQPATPSTLAERVGREEAEVHRCSRNLAVTEAWGKQHKCQQVVPTCRGGGGHDMDPQDPGRDPLEGYRWEESK